MTLESIRLTFKQLRFEVLAIIGALLALAVALIVLAVRLGAIDIAACSGLEQPVDCAARHAQVDGLFSFVFGGQVLAAVLPLFGALVLGVAVVGRELERGTATLAWPLARSRSRWLVTRWAIVGAAVFAAALLVGMASDAVHQGSTTSGSAPSFDMVDWRGWVIAVRVAMAFTLAVILGALLGRTLPGLLVAIIATAILVLGVDFAMGAWVRGQAVPLDVAAVNEARVIDTDWRDVTTGRVLTRQEYVAVTPPPDAPADWYAVAFEPIPIGVAGTRVGDYLLVEGLIVVGITIVLLGGSMVVVERRTPY